MFCGTFTQNNGRFLLKHYIYLFTYSALQPSSIKAKNFFNFYYLVSMPQRPIWKGRIAKSIVYMSECFHFIWEYSGPKFKGNKKSKILFKQLLDIIAKQMGYCYYLLQASLHLIILRRGCALFFLAWYYLRLPNKTYYLLGSYFKAYFKK